MATLASESDSTAAPTTTIPIAPKPAMAIIDSITLRTLLEELPQELYDEIKNMTFTAYASPQQDLTTDTGMAEFKHHLMMLQVNSTSRVQYGKSYFPTRTFVMGRGLIKWLVSLSGTHQEQISDVEVPICRCCPHDVSEAEVGRLHAGVRDAIISTVRSKIGLRIANVLRLHFRCNTASPKFSRKD